MKFINKLLTIGILELIFLFLGLQVIYIFYLNNEVFTIEPIVVLKSLPTLNFSLYLTDNVTRIFGTFLLVLGFLISLPIFAPAKRDGKRSRWSKSKYEKSSYARFLKKFERVRGTQRIQYDDNGDITRDTFEVFMEKLFHPIVKFHNDICETYHFPAPKIWNTIRTFYVDEKPQNHCGGIPVIALRKYFLFGKFNRVYYLFGNIHSMFLGMTGKGKSFSFVLTMLNSYIQANESIVVHDPKCELYAYTKKKLERQGYKVILLNFDKPDYGDSWNPLYYPYMKWKEVIFNYCCEQVYNFVSASNTESILISLKEMDKTIDDSTSREIIDILQSMSFDDVKNIDGYKNEKVRTFVYYLIEKTPYDVSELNMSAADELIQDISNTMCYEEDAKQPYFWQGAAKMIAGGARLMMEEGNDRFVNFKSIRYIFQDGDDNKNGRETLIAKYLDKYRPEDAKSKEFFSTYLDAEGITKSSLKSVFQSKIDLVTVTEDITKMTSNNTFDMRDIFKSKTAVFLMTQDEKTTYYPLVSMFFKQLYEVGIKITKESDKEKKLKIPMNWIIDEFALLPEIMDIDAIYSAARSRGVRINTFFQSPNQLYKKYEVNGSKSIIDNNTNVIYLGSGLPETKTFFKERVGKELHYNKWKREFEERDLITEHKLNMMEKGRSLFTSVEWNPFIAKLPPYTDFTFYEEPDWDLDLVKKNKVEYFKIRNAYEYRREEELKKMNTKVLKFNKVN